MKFSKTMFLGIGGTVLAGLLLAPKAAHAVVAAFVQVVNDVAVVNPTPSGTVQPIIATETDSLSRVPYQDSCMTLNHNPIDATLTCATSVVPAGKRLVIEEVTAFCQAPTGKATAAAIYATVGSSFIPHFLTLTPQDGIVGSPGSHYATSELVRFYVDPSSVPQFAVSSGDSAASCSATLSGYLEPTNIQ